VNMSVQAGSITAVIGPNGAGKTSLFNVATGFEEPTEGQVLFEGEDVTGLEPWRVARKGTHPHLPDSDRVPRSLGMGEPDGRRNQ
jgi:ABC-type branched-subunit amino acid transport system ATPase component